MNREDVIQLALDHGVQSTEEHWGTVYRAVSGRCLEEFANAIEAKTLERAAQVAEEPYEFTSPEASRIAAAIRALGEKA